MSPQDTLYEESHKNRVQQCVCVCVHVCQKQRIQGVVPVFMCTGNWQSEYNIGWIDGWIWNRMLLFLHYVPVCGFNQGCEPG